MITPETSEKKLIKDWLNLTGWFVYHNLAGLGVYPGIADLTAIKEGVIVQIEIKTKANKQSDRQREFEGRWKTAGGYYVSGGFDKIKEYIENICTCQFKEVSKHVTCVHNKNCLTRK